MSLDIKARAKALGEGGLGMKEGKKVEQSLKSKR